MPSSKKTEMMEVENRPLIDYSDATEDGEISFPNSNNSQKNFSKLNNQTKSHNFVVETNREEGEFAKESDNHNSSSSSVEKKRKREETEENKAEESHSPRKEARSNRHDDRSRSKERSSRHSSSSGHHHSSSHRSHRSRSRDRKDKDHSHSQDRKDRDRNRDRSRDRKEKDRSKPRSRSRDRKDRDHSHSHRDRHEQERKEDRSSKSHSEAKEKVSSSSTSNLTTEKKTRKESVKETDNGNLPQSPSTTTDVPDVLYQKKVEEALKIMEMEEETEEEKIRKARERRKAILMKYQQQIQSTQEPPISESTAPSDNSQVKPTEEPGIFSPKELSSTVLSQSSSNLPSSSQTIGTDKTRFSSSPSTSPPSSPLPFEQNAEQSLFDESLAQRNLEDQQEPEMQDETLANEKIQAFGLHMKGTLNDNENNNHEHLSPRLQQKSQVKDSFDMFSDSPDLSPVGPHISEKVAKAAITSESLDDAEGYYCYRTGEVLNQRFLLLGSYGKGVFSTVIRATDQQNGKEVAVKILRNNEAMKRMGLKEIELLKQIAQIDPEGKYNCVKLIHHFEDRNHLCLVFEALSGGNLREVLRKYGNKIGLKIQAVKVFGHKLMLALKLLKKLKIFHADLKPDNILVNDIKTSVKLADFGSASPVTENAITPFLVSRWYRAPEIMLGLPYSYEIDMWSLGCTLFEIATGNVLFPGKSNNEMLYFIMEVSGPVPKKMIKKGAFAAENFDDNGNFKRYMKDSLTNKEYIKVCQITQPTRDLKTELLNSPYQLTADEKRMLVNLHDLLMKIFVFDPARRITVQDALRHPFFAK